MKETKDWFKPKKYPHIGFQIQEKDRPWVEKYIKDPKKISQHAFLPFIHRTSTTRKFRKKYSTDNGCVIKSSQGEILRHKSDKKRELYYASHLDSLIFSYYTSLLANKYEEKIKANSLDQVVCAYRTIPVDPTNLKKSNKCNIHFADDVFNFIRSYPKSEFYTITFDIKSFFDNLDHKLLRESWKLILDIENLPPDHFNVYKNITRYCFVDIVDLFEEFKHQIIIQKKYKNGEYSPKKKKKVSSIKYLRNQDAISFCSKDDFFKHKNKLLKNSKTIKKDGVMVIRNFGIPQGSPISSILANIYLFEFDKSINNVISEFHGLYRRYSDDMVVVCPFNEKDNVLKLFKDKIELYKLEIQESKTQIFHFSRKDNKVSCAQEFKDGVNKNKNLIYLGFEFDGTYSYIKSASISGYYRKMKRTINRSIIHSNKKSNKNRGEIFKRRILKKFTYKGAKRRRKWLWDTKRNGFVKSEHYDWGNFLTYAYKASDNMKKNKIKQQTKRHWAIINHLLQKK